MSRMKHSITLQQVELRLAGLRHVSGLMGRHYGSSFLVDGYLTRFQSFGKRSERWTSNYWS